MDNHDRFGKIIFTRYNTTETLPEELKPLPQAPPEVVQRWINGRYLQRQRIGPGYRYTGLFLSICGYYEYQTFFADANENPKTKGIARFFLEKGEIAFVAVRTNQYSYNAKGNASLRKSCAKLRSMFSAFYEDSSNTTLAIPYCLKEKNRNEATKLSNADSIISYLSDCYNNEQTPDQQPYGVIELNVDEHERSATERVGQPSKIVAGFKHLESQK